MNNESSYQTGPPMMEEPRGIRPLQFPPWVLHAVFLMSGISALLYQMIWQRALMLIYGTNIESVSLVVSAFLVGLGLGSIAGGELSKSSRLSPILLFAMAEFLVGIYGICSLGLFRWVGRYTLTLGMAETGFLVFSLVFIPTLMMGATLPLLVAHRVQSTAHVGRSVTWLYSVNTIGGAAGSFLAVFVILGAFGLSGSVRLAALLNGFSAIVVLSAWMRSRRML